MKNIIIVILSFFVGFQGCSVQAFENNSNHDKASYRNHDRYDKRGYDNHQHYQNKGRYRKYDYDRYEKNRAYRGNKKYRNEVNDSYYLGLPNDTFEWIDKYPTEVTSIARCKGGYNNNHYGGTDVYTQTFQTKKDYRTGCSRSQSQEEGSLIAP